MEKQTLSYEKVNPLFAQANPEEIIFKLRAIIKFLGEQNGGNE